MFQYSYLYYIENKYIYTYRISDRYSVQYYCESLNEDFEMLLHLFSYQCIACLNCIKNVKLTQWGIFKIEYLKPTVNLI